MISEKQFHKMCQINIDGLSTHSRIAVDKYISENNIEILALQEAGEILKDDNEGEAEDIFTNLTSSWHYGCHGVGLSVSPKFKPQHVKELSSTGVDSVFILCKIRNKSVMIVSCYCRPEISSTKSLKTLLKNIDDAWSWCLTRQVKSMIVLGDFNARSTNWGDKITNPRGKLLSNYLEERNHVSSHSAATQTFVTSNGGSIIDLSLSFGDVTPYLSTPWTENCYTLFTGAPRRGHLPVFQTVEVSGNKRSDTREVLDYDSADWDGWSTEMEEVFSQKIREISQSPDHEDPAQLFSFLLDNIKACHEKFIPKKRVCSYSKPFWCERLSYLSKELQNAQKEYHFKSDPQNKANLEESKTKFQEALTREKNSWIHMKLDGLNTADSIEFWKRYKKQFIKQSVPSISHLYSDKTNKKLVSEDKEKETILFDTFFSGKHLTKNSFDEEHQKTVKAELHDIINENWDMKTDKNASNHTSNNTDEHHTDFLNDEISYYEVLSAIKAQKTSGKCSDEDRIHPVILKMLPRSCIEFLTLLFNQVFKSGKWVWNSSMISFIKKAEKESYLNPGAYRPITIASYVGKILERVLQGRLLLFCQREKIIDEAQEGFLPQRNTVRYLYKMSASIAEARRKKMTAMLLFLDFEKAFDSVPVASLIVKLHRYGVTGIFLKLIYSFLTSRTMTLKVNNYIGPQREAKDIGLPQGSVLSPLLFIIYVADLLSPNDLPVKIAGEIHSYKYADDGSVLVAANSTTNCHLIMQKVCNYLYRWCRKWRLVINCSKNKTESIIMKSKDTSVSIVPKLKIGSDEIQYVQKSKILGVIVDDDLKFDQQAKTILKNCWYAWHRLSNNTTRKKGLNSLTLAVLFKTVVLTKLLYAAPIWLNKNLDIFSDLMSRALLKIHGGQLHIPKAMSEVIANIPPLSLLLEMVSLKFCLKGLSSDYEMQAFIMQLEDTPSHPFYIHTIWLKKYIAEKNKLHSYRSINFFNLQHDDLFYKKESIDLYQYHKWDSLIRRTEISHFIEKDQHITSKDLEIIKTENIKNFPLLKRYFNRNSSSDILDFLHGRCLLFGKFKKTLNQSESEICEDCDFTEDTSAHKLFDCPAFCGTTRNNLIAHFDDEISFSNYQICVIFGETDVKKAFSEHVQFIMQNTVSSDGYKG